MLSLICRVFDKTMNLVNFIDFEFTFISGDESFERFNSVTVSVDDLCFPLTNALFAGQSKLDTAAACYIKYRFYDKSKHLLIYELPKFLLV